MYIYIPCLYIYIYILLIIHTYAFHYICIIYIYSRIYILTYIMCAYWLHRSRKIQKLIGVQLGFPAEMWRLHAIRHPNGGSAHAQVLRRNPNVW